jgi:hypothetical protein
MSELSYKVMKISKLHFFNTLNADFLLTDKESGN